MQLLMAGLKVALIVTVVTGFYFLPTLIGEMRRVERIGFIFLVNLLFGVTVLGWLFALGLALTGRDRTTVPLSK